MKHLMWAITVGLCLSLVATPGGKTEAQRRAKKPAKSAETAVPQPKPENQFVTVEEFVQRKPRAGAAASIEGYVALGYMASDGSLRLALVDSLDHILNTKDANREAARGVMAIAPARILRAHSAWRWSAKGAQRLPMYTGRATAQKQMRDIAPRVRLTGLAASGKAPALSPLLRIEYQDDNGDWKRL